MMRRIGALIGIAVVALSLVLFGTGAIAADSEVPLQRGLNEVVYTGETAPVQEALTSIDGLYSVVFHWDVTAQQWRTFRPPPAPALLSDLTALEEGKIYWIVVDQSLRLTIVEPVPPPPPCVSPVDSPFMRRYEGIFAAAEGHLAAVEDLAARYEADPELYEEADPTMEQFMVRFEFDMDTLVAAVGLTDGGAALAALEVPSDFAELAPLLADVARRAGALGESLNWREGIVFRFEIPEARSDIDEIRADHAELLALAAGWCDQA